MDYLVFFILALIGICIAGTIAWAAHEFGGFNLATICISTVAIVFSLAIVATLVSTKAPSKNYYSKKEVLESQKIEAIIDSNVKPIENGRYREAVSKDYTMYGGIVLYTSDKELDKTYQKVRYYDDLSLYTDSDIIYLYDPIKALTKDEQSKAEAFFTVATIAATGILITLVAALVLVLIIKVRKKDLEIFDM